MTRLDPNPPPAAGRDTGFAAIEAALSTLAEPAPARLGHAKAVGWVISILLSSSSAILALTDDARCPRP
jgi:hypothetical protein